jgi:hypothetical protein
MYPKCGNLCGQRGRKRFIASWGLRMSHICPCTPCPFPPGYRSKVESRHFAHLLGKRKGIYDPATPKVTFVSYRSKVPLPSRPSYGALPSRPLTQTHRCLKVKSDINGDKYRISQICKVTSGLIGNNGLHGSDINTRLKSNT